ncbi:Insulin-like growth factor binding protein, N-terminal [Pseudocohnilembus persalinus]|uniref:Insulin-like growth factor binding protein, N-terminal n=1 Tax=Pseudocohnilembus persalinus TaxID=266149 RepID=A0A0V0QJP4_PSEPJ|nr:Insulin-like growth factor binding protein, N-terminal [Pseudocohnilembus persalinus]|eukprot:KRX02509.1 Insulin-like growth factor binding protein, N-terminal [Pseudocohnilembus persalinus]
MQKNTNLNIYQLLICLLLVNQFFSNDNIPNTDDTSIPQLERNYEKKIQHEQLNTSLNRSFKTTQENNSPIRITFDYQDVDSVSLQQKPVAEFLINQMEFSKKILSEKFNVIRSKYNNQNNEQDNNIFEYEGNCLDVNVQKEDRKQGISDSDLHIYVIWDEDRNTDYTIQGRACYYYEGELPTFGRIKFNLNQYQQQDLNDINSQSQFMTIIHEIMNILGYKYELNKSLIDYETGTYYDQEDLQTFSQKYCSKKINGCQICEDQNTCIKCLDEYFLENQSCKKCSYPCLQCSSNDECLTCVADSNRDQNTCECLQGYQEVDNSLTCSLIPNQKECPYPCNTCDENQCLTCIGENRDYAPDCKCNIGYYDDNAECKKCAENCADCSSISECYQCTDGYYLENQNCLQCNYPCKTCKNADTCLTCLGENRENGKNGCQCIQGYQENQKGECEKIIDEICQNGEYFDKKQGNCKSCIQGCETCDQNQCLSCNVGYTFAGEQCIQCSQFNQNCIECDDLYTCKACGLGSYLNLNTQKCDKCPTYCYTCEDDQTCTSCQGEKKIVEKNCQCADGYKMNEYGNCDEICTGILTIYADFVSLDEISYIVTFSDPSDNKFIPQQYLNKFSNEICQYILEDDFINKFGQNPLCQILQAQNLLKISIISSYETNYQLSVDYLQLKVDVISQNSCDYSLYLEDIEGYLGNHDIFKSEQYPKINDDGVYYKQDCNSVYFGIKEIQNDGKRSLQNIEWQIIESDQQDQDLNQVNNYLKQYNSNNQYEIEIQSQYLKNHATYKMLIQFQNYMSLKGEYEFEFQVSKNSSPSIEFQNQNIISGGFIEIKENEQLIFNLSHQICYDLEQIQNINFSYQLQIINAAEEMIYTDKNEINNPKHQLILTPKFDTYMESVFLTLSVKSNNEISYFNLEYQVQQMPYILEILGGNRQIIPFNQDQLILKASLTQQEFGNLIDIDENDITSIVWSGVDLETGKNLNKNDGENLELKNDQLKQVMDLKNILRGKNYKFNIKTEYKGVEQDFSVEIYLENQEQLSKNIIVNQDVQKVEISEFIFQRDVNLKENIEINVLFNSKNVLTQNFIYEIVFFYNENELGQNIYYYPAISFSLLDLIGQNEDVDIFQKENNKGIVQVTVLNIDDLTQFQVEFDINFVYPIQKGILQVDIIENDSILTLYQLSASQFIGEQLQYKFLYKQNKKSQNMYSLNSYSQENTIQTFLPYSQEVAYIIVQVQDQYGFTVQSDIPIELNQNLEVNDKLEYLQKYSQTENLFDKINYNTFIYLEISQNLNKYILNIGDKMTQIFSVFTQSLKAQTDYDLDNNLMEILTNTLNLQNKDTNLCQYITKSQIDSLIQVISDVNKSEYDQMIQYSKEIINNDLVKVLKFEDDLKNQNFKNRIHKQLHLLENALDCQNYLQQKDNQNDTIIKAQINDINNNQLQEILSQTISQFNQFSLPNEDYLYYNGNQYKILAQRMTYNRLKNFLYTDVQNAFVNKIGNKQLNILNQGIDDDFIMGNNNIENVYSVQMIQYYDNIYINDDSFLNQEQNVNIQNLKIRQQDFTSSQVLEEDIHFIDKYTVSFIFSKQNKIYNDDDRYTCIQYDEINQEWFNEFCSTEVYEENIICECSKLYATTVVYDELGYFFPKNSVFVKEKINWTYGFLICLYVAQIFLSLYGQNLDKKNKIQDTINQEKSQIIQENDQIIKINSDDMYFPKLNPIKKQSSISQQLGDNILKIKKKMSSLRHSDREFPLITQLQIFHMLLQIIYIFDEKISRVVRFQFFMSKYILAMGLTILVSQLSFGQILVFMISLSFILSLYTRLMNDLQACFQSEDIYIVISSIINGFLQISFTIITIMQSDNLSYKQSMRFSQACILAVIIEILVVQSAQAYIGYLIYKITKKDFIYSRTVRSIMMIQQKIQ